MESRITAFAAIVAIEPPPVPFVHELFSSVLPPEGATVIIESIEENG